MSKTDPISIKRQRKFKVGDKVTAKSILAKSMLLGVPRLIQLAQYPSLIGIELTIIKITDPWIICERESGTTAPGLMVEDIELLEVGNEI